MIEISLGERLHELRNKADLSLRELSKKVGISGPFLSDIELGSRECVGDDLEVTDQVSFTHLAGAKPDETVIFSWIVFESRESRDQVNAKVMADPRIKEMCDAANSPFDFKRMAYGGFKVLVDA